LVADSKLHRGTPGAETFRDGLLGLRQVGAFAGPDIARDAVLEHPRVRNDHPPVAWLTKRTIAAAVGVDPWRHTINTIAGAINATVIRTVQVPAVAAIRRFGLASVVIAITMNQLIERPRDRFVNRTFFLLSFDLVSGL
jgi:hypothetical protein